MTAIQKDIETLQDKLTKLNSSDKINLSGGELEIQDTLTLNNTAKTNSLIPQDDDEYDLGSEDKGFDNAYIHQLWGSSILTIGDNNTSHNLTNNNDLLISGNLEVDSIAYFDGGINAGGQLISNLADPLNPQDAVTKAYYEANTPTGVFSRTGTTITPTTAGDAINFTNSLLTFDSLQTFGGSTLNKLGYLSNASSDIQVQLTGLDTDKEDALTKGDITAGTGITLTGDITDAVIGSGFTISLPQSIATTSSPTFAGATISTGGINVTGASTFNNNLTVNGLLGVTNTLTVSAGGMDVTGDATFQDSLSVTGDLTVNGGIDANGIVADITDMNLWELFEPQQDVTWQTDCDKVTVDGDSDSCALTQFTVYDGSRYIYWVGGRNDSSVRQIYLQRYDTWKRFGDIDSYAKFNLLTLTGLTGENDDNIKFGSLLLIGTDLFIAPDPASPYWVKYDTTASIASSGSYTVYDHPKTVGTCAANSHLIASAHGVPSGTERYFRLSGTSAGGGTCGIAENLEFYGFAVHANRLLLSPVPGTQTEIITSCNTVSDEVTITNATNNRILYSTNADCGNIAVTTTYYTCDCVGSECKLQLTSSGFPTGGVCTAAINLTASVSGTGAAYITDTVTASNAVVTTTSPAASGSIQTMMGYRQIAKYGTDIYGVSFDLTDYGNIATKFNTTAGTFSFVDLAGVGLGADANEGYFGVVATHDGGELVFTPYNVNHDKFLHLDTTATFDINAFTVFDATTVGSKTRIGYHGGWEDDYYTYYLPYGEANGLGTENGTILKRDKSLAFDDSSAWSIYKDLLTVNVRANAFWSVKKADTTNNQRFYMLTADTPQNATDASVVVCNPLLSTSSTNFCKFVDTKTEFLSGTGEGYGTSLEIANGYLYLFSKGTGGGKGGEILRFPLEKIH